MKIKFRSVKSFTLYFLIGFPIVLSAQKDGIHFEQMSNWQQVLVKAKAEKKNIFVDCYASWCGPCKWMDKEVYINDTLGDYMNSKFISIKVQMDETDHDVDLIKRWHDDAKMLEKQFRINAYPTFLFFSSDGKIQYKEVGSRDAQSFIRMTDSLKKSNEHYSALLVNYESGERDTADMRFLIEESEKLGQMGKADTISKGYIQTLVSFFDGGEKKFVRMNRLISEAQRFGERDLADSLAKIYIDQYLETLPEEQLWTMENLDFIDNNLRPVSPDSKLFLLIYKDRKTIDSVMKSERNYFSTRLVLYVLIRKEVPSMITQNTNNKSEPDWDVLIKDLEKKYDQYTSKWVVYYSAADFYEEHKNWNKLANFLFLKDELDIGIASANNLNAYAWEVFKYSEVNQQLQSALRWANQAVEIARKNDDPDISAYMDTQANLLYKLGMKKEALNIEKKIARFAPDDKETQSNLQKMMEGKPTWKN